MSTPEPFQKLVNQGMILGENNEKMSKSRGNVINPDAIVTEYGADSLRLYEMYMGPLEATKPWSMQGVNGVYDFLNRVWRLIIDDRAETMQLNAAVVDRPPTADENRVLHRTIDAVTDDIDKLTFNTAIARMMEFTNYFTTASERPREVLEKFVLLLSPFAPHMAEELWQALGHTEVARLRAVAGVRPGAGQGGLRSRCRCRSTARCGRRSRCRADADAAAARSGCRAADRARRRTCSMAKQVVKVIVVPGRLVNL